MGKEKRMSDKKVLAFLEPYDENLKDLVNGLLIERREIEETIENLKDQINATLSAADEVNVSLRDMNDDLENRIAALTTSLSATSDLLVEQQEKIKECDQIIANLQLNLELCREAKDRGLTRLSG